LTIAVAPAGRATTAELQEDLRVISARLRSLHLATATLVGNHILVTASTKELAQAESLATDPGNLRFRQVLAVHPNADATAKPSVNRAASLTPALLTSLAQWDCRTNPDPTDGADAATEYVLACNEKQSRVYLLAPASLEGADVRSADAGLDVENSHSWVVNLMLTPAGATRWLALTKKTYEVTEGPASGYPDCAPPKGCNAIGIVLDGVVESDPATEGDGIPGGLTVISGDFSQAEAVRLEAVLRGGHLLVPLQVVG
jgi:preprotein translocase subunit SecD